MDTALELKIAVQNDSISDSETAQRLLKKSELFKELLVEFEQSSINLLHRLIQLSEIPFSKENQNVQEWRNKLADLTFCEVGFSLTGKSDDILACYNAMITSVLIKLDYPNNLRISKGIEWIMKYQNTERNQPTLWKGKGIQKYGGCMKSTPCFIGVVKSIIALSDYKQKGELENNQVKEKLNNGLEYILEHKVFKKKSKNEPITKDITKLTYPFTYKTNIVEILRLLNTNKRIDDPRVDEAKELVNKKKKGDSWRANSFYKPKYWVDFNKPKQKSEWVDFEIKNTIRNNVSVITVDSTSPESTQNCKS